jgi:protein-tyrosine phosphatase
MEEQYNRQVAFDNILNFRDLGGFKARGRRTVARGRVFRSGEMHHATERDITRLKKEFKLKMIIDLRSVGTIEKLGIEPFEKIGAAYHNLPFVLISDSTNDTDKRIFEGFTNSTQTLFYRVSSPEYGQKIVQALEIIAAPRNHPVVFHCNAGKDRSGVLAAILLKTLGVENADVIADYCLTALCLDEFIARWDADPRTADVHKSLPSFQKEVVPETMSSFLAMLKKEYGSAAGYLKDNGAEASLVARLEAALLVEK